MLAVKRTGGISGCTEEPAASAVSAIMKCRFKNNIKGKYLNRSQQMAKYIFHHKNNTCHEILVIRKIPKYKF